jgi:ankyrin repeat protein
MVFACLALLLAGLAYFHGRLWWRQMPTHGPYVMSSFEQAIAYGDLPTLEKELKSKPSLATKRLRDSDFPLNRAVHSAHPKETIELLLKYGADINTKGSFFNTTPLQNAAWQGNTEVVKTLLAHKPEVNAVNDSDGVTALHFALVADNKEIFNLLLAAGADINRGRSVLTECMVYGGDSRAGWAEFLLSKGADPNRLGPEGDRFARMFQTGKHWDTNDVTTLNPYQMVPLHFWALGDGDPAIADLLRAQNADVNVPDEAGLTPLHLAVDQGQKQAIEWLLKHGANVNARDKHGITPLGLLQLRSGQERRKDIADLLRKHGADEMSPVRK